ncbi:Beta-fructofuranosidase, cell wall isozyme [Hibiscus syriacus]|uniref:Beta-fructofuranosidase, cell wall isozyme n=1 Tax=Hibiscus syriacus TaxID=106335 RepID=A0A6A2WZF2_HIBSY|nr:Beta-fructofuranosidase, cell wall isozyme [Hibiscus syriacus]
MLNNTNSNVAFFLFFALFVGHGIVELQALHHVYIQAVKSYSSAKQPYRTGYHFQPPKNWINDPNGVMVYKGVFHLFYQYNPKGAEWGNIVWAHSTSKDLVNWTPHEPDIYPSQPSDIKGCWSGSATILHGGKPVILYTGIEPHQREVQNLAIPKNLSDPYLREWVKSDNNPLMQPTAQNHINATRDYSSSTKSKDFVNWFQSKTPLHSANNTGIWECPDFYPVPIKGESGVDTSLHGPSVKHVLKVSLDDTKLDLYTIGSYNNVKDIYRPDDGSVEGDLGLRYDNGKYYASKNFFDSVEKRRILMDWNNESSKQVDDIKKGWSGIHAIPRKVCLAENGKQLVQWPIAEIQKLRANHVSLANKLLEGGSVIEVSGVTAAQADVEVSFETKDFDKAERPSRSSLNENTDKATYGAFLDVDIQQQKLSLRSLIDHSIVESFGGGGKVCITSRVYPTLAINKAAHLYAFNNGTQSIRLKI